MLSKRLTEANQHVRELAHGIMPVQVDAEGLRSALSLLAVSIREHNKIQCRFESSGAVPIPNNTVATHLYRIVQEAVTNAMRHGNASEITISLGPTADRITLDISDNGMGYDESLGR